MIGGLIVWIVIGLIVGFVGSKLVKLRGDDPRLGIGAAVGGAVVGGILYTIISGVDLRVWNVWMMVVVLIVAVVGVVAWHVVRSRTISRDSYTVRKSY